MLTDACCGYLTITQPCANVFVTLPAGITLCCCTVWQAEVPMEGQRARVSIELESGMEGGSIEDRGEDDKYEDVEQEVRVEVPMFRPLPEILVFPNLPMLAVWFFGAGLVSKAVALLSWQATQDSSASDLSDALECSWPCSLAAGMTLFTVGAALGISLKMLLHFWRRFRKTSWQPTTKALKPIQVNDPALRLWSWLKTKVSRSFHTPPPRPSDERAAALFTRYDKSGDGLMDATELLRALEELGVLSVVSADSSLPTLLRSSRELSTGPLAERSINEGSSTATLQRSQTRLAQVVRSSTSPLATLVRSSTSPLARPRTSSLSRSSTSTSFGSSKLMRSQTISKVMDASQLANLTRRQRFALAVLAKHDKDGNRLINKQEFDQIVVQVQAKLTLLPPQQRMTGKWVKPMADVKEPARTERILAHPFTIMWGHSTDCQDAMSFCLLAKTSGTHFSGMSYQLITMLIQVILGAANGMGPYITKGAAAANAQVLSVAIIKLTWAAVLARCHLCACGLTNLMVVCQLVSEGTVPILLLLGKAGHIGEAREALLQTTCFLLLLIPVFMPIFLMVYDTSFVNLYTVCSRKKLNRQNLVVSLLQMVLVIPSFLSRVAGGAKMAFDPAKLMRTVKSMVANVNQQRAIGKTQTVVVKRTVRQKKACAKASDESTQCQHAAFLYAPGSGEGGGNDDGGEGGGGAT